MATAKALRTPSSPRNTYSADPSTILEQRWWNTNLPQEQWTRDCPDFLQGQDEKNIGVLSTRDEDYPRMLWPEAKHVVDTNRIGLFHRMPSDLRRYIKYLHDLKQRYSSVLYFIQHERLNWPSLDPSTDTPFTNEADYKILLNDWPYAVDPDIVHIVVWTKFELKDDPATGELETEYKQLIETFVVSTFCEDSTGQPVVARNNLIWFKNWRRLRSVQALEHFHVMLYNAPKKLIQRVTNGDQPMCELFAA